MNYEQGAVESSQPYEAEPVQARGVNAPLIAMVLAAVYVLGSGYFMYNLGSRVGKVENAQQAVIQSAELRNKAMMDQLGMTEAGLKQSTQDLQVRLGRTQPGGGLPTTGSGSTNCSRSRTASACPSWPVQTPLGPFPVRWRS